MKNSMQTDVELFMEACDQEVKPFPALPSKAIRDLRIRLMVTELLGSAKTDLAPDGFPYCDILVPDKSNELIQSMVDEDLVGVADGIADLLYVVIGTAAAYGIDIQPIFDEVQRSNMSKAIWDDFDKVYVVVKDEGGKVVKPPTYSPAELEPIVAKQITDGYYQLAKRV